MTNKGLMIPGTPDETWSQITNKIIDELTDDIPEKVVRATELMLSGLPVAKVAKSVGVTPDTVKSWIRKYPTVAHVLSEGRRYLQLWRMSQLEQQFVQAIDKSSEILDLSLQESDGVNVKLAGIQAQHARYIIGLFAGQQIDLKVSGPTDDPVLKAKADALDYLAEQLAKQETEQDEITVSYRVIDERAAKTKPLLNSDGDPVYGQLGSFDITKEGTLCHICGSRYRLMGIHISKDHTMKVDEYERTFLLDEGAVADADSNGREE